MDTQKWRPRANIVASIDAVLAALDCFVIVLMIVITFVRGPVDLIKFIRIILDESNKEESFDKRVEESELHHITVSVWISLGTGVIYCLIEAVVAKTLMTACKPSCELNVAARNASTWRNIKILFILYFIKRIFHMIINGVNVLDQFYVGKLIGNLVGIAIVQKFINEIDQIHAISRNGNPNYDLSGALAQNDSVNPLASNLNSMNI